MDLAEIRKKANAGKGMKVSGRPEEKNQLSGASPRIQDTPTAPENDRLFQAEKAPSDEGREKIVRDPLQALFENTEDVFSSEEDYLQSLVGENELRINDEMRRFLSFSLGEEEYALDINHIREIIKPREITDLPRVPDYILGIISLRGIITSVFDLKKRLKLGNGEISANSRIVVCQQEDRSVGLLVDSISQVVNLPIPAIEPPPSVLSGLDRDLVEGVGRIQGKMIILLNLPCVLNAELN